MIGEQRCRAGEHDSLLNIIPYSIKTISPFFFSFSYCRSTDYGTTYEKLNDKVGLKTVLSYLYVNPTNKRKVRGRAVALSTSAGSSTAEGQELRKPKGHG